jgi:hypothetical protein
LDLSKNKICQPCHCTLHNIVLQVAVECRDYHTCIQRTTLGSHSEVLKANWMKLPRASCHFTDYSTYPKSQNFRKTNSLLNNLKTWYLCWWHFLLIINMNEQHEAHQNMLHMWQPSVFFHYPTFSGIFTPMILKSDISGLILNMIFDQQYVDY